MSFATTSPSGTQDTAAEPVVAAAVTRARPQLSLLCSIAAFGALFGRELWLMAEQWVSDPEAGHGLLLALSAGWLVWQTPVGGTAGPRSRIVGSCIVAAASIAAIVTMLGASSRTGARVAMIAAGIGLVVFHAGWAALRARSLPAVLILMSIPIPQVLLTDIAMPLQLVASRLGAGLLDARGVPVVLEGNIIHLPGRDLFVTEACSGLRSLWALGSLAVLIGALWLRTLPTRVALVVVAVPIAVALNGLRVFLTGFLTYLVDPDFGTGFLHFTEGWVMFGLALALLSVCAWACVRFEQLRGRGTSQSASGEP